MQSLSRQILFSLGCLLASYAITGTESACASSFDVYLSAPGSQATIYASTTVETFSEFATGTYTTPLVGPAGFGNYMLDSTHKLAVVANNQYGTGTGNFVALGSQAGSSTPVTLNLTSPQSYFGFSWNAGDTNNTVAFYNGSNLIASYSTANVLGLLKNTYITAGNGTQYTSSSYNGQPSTHLNPNEPYAFINFFYNAGKFTSIVFGNSGSTGTGFESDNHTIRTDSPPPDLTFVYVGSAVPEPSSVALAAGMSVSVGIFALRRRKPRKSIRSLKAPTTLSP